MSVIYSGNRQFETVIRQRWRLPPAQNLVHMRFNPRSAPVAWARCIALAIHGWSGM
jgi:hypothetical protein